MSATASVQLRTQQVAPASATASVATRAAKEEHPRTYAQPSAASTAVQCDNGAQCGNGTTVFSSIALTTEEGRPDIDSAAATSATSRTSSQAASLETMSTPGADSRTSSQLVEQQESARQAATTSVPPTPPTRTGTAGSRVPSTAGGAGGRQPLSELGVPGGGASGGGSGNAGSSGDAPRGNRDFVLTKERVAAVRCYFREDDPLFIRANLSKLREGTLKPLAAGDTVKAARRYDTLGDCSHS